MGILARLLGADEGMSIRPSAFDGFMARLRSCEPGSHLSHSPKSASSPNFDCMVPS
jgi:hypothetical protein